jgi:hypothetical protein
VLQGVSDMFEMKLLEPRTTTNARNLGDDGEGEGEDGDVKEVGRGKIVFIGRGVDDGLKRAFSSYLGLDA